MSEDGIRAGWRTGPPEPVLPEPTGDGGPWDLAVVGLGGSGLEAIRAGLERNLRVVGVDAQGVAAGAAGANGGFLLAGLADFHHEASARFGPEWVAWVHRQTEAFIRTLAARDPDLVELHGSIRRWDSLEEKADVLAHHHALRRDGLASFFSSDEGLVLVNDAAFDPARLAHREARRLRAGGATFFRMPVEEVEPGAIRGEGHRISARRIVVATDAGISSLFSELSDRVRVVRLQMLSTEPDGPAPPAARRPVYSRFGYDYWQQRPDGRWMVGGGRDLDPAAELGPRGERADAGSWAPRPTQPAQVHLDGLLRDVIRSSARVQRRWAAPVGYTFDGLPVLSEVRPRVWAVGGFCGTGNVIGRLLGRAAVELALERPGWATGRWLERLTRRQPVSP